MHQGGFGNTTSDGGSVPRGRPVARAGPAPVLTEASIRRRREHSRQASLDMAAREGVALLNGDADSIVERRASYMAQTESSLRHASVGSEASMTGSVRRLRTRGGSAGRDDVSDVASVASSQWSVRRRRVAPRTVKPVEPPAPQASTERAQRIAARTAAQRAAGGVGDGGDGRLQGNAVVVRGGARVAASRKSSLEVSDDASPHALAADRRQGSSAGGAASPSLTTVTVSDDDTGELTKSGVSVSLSPITSGARSARRSLHHARHGSASGGAAQRGTGDVGSSAEGDLMDDAEAEEEPVPRPTQPMSFDGYPAGGAPSRAGHAAGSGRGAAAVDKSGRPPLTPRGDASPRPGGAPRRGSLGGSQTVPATTLTSNTVHRASSSFDQPPPQRRGSVGESVVPARGSSVGTGATAIHRVTENGRRSSDYDGAPKSFDDTVDDTPISVLKERANREAEHNARRDSDQPLVPRLALSEITAKRDRQRRSASYQVAHGDAAAFAMETPMTGGSALSDVTVSSMTDSATPHQHGGGGRSGRAHGGDGRPTQAEDIRVDPSPAASAGNDAPTYDSHGTSPARDEAAGAATTTLSPSRTAAPPEPATAAPQPPAATAPPATASSAAKTRDASRERKTPGAVAAEGNVAPSTQSKQPSPPAAAAPAQSATAERKKKRGFEKSPETAPNTATAAPPVAASKEKAKCCVMM